MRGFQTKETNKNTVVVIVLLFCLCATASFLFGCVPSKSAQQSILTENEIETGTYHEKEDNLTPSQAVETTTITQSPTPTPTKKPTPQPTKKTTPQPTNNQTPETTEAVPSATETANEQSESTEKPESKVAYVANRNTKKFHKPFCASVKDIKDSNRWDFTGERQELIDMGYVPCKRCNP